jgi:hypothetical protein
MELNQMQKALYYLEVASHSNAYKHVQEYINCLSNTNSSYTLNVIEYVTNRSPKPELDKDIEEWNFHIAFLKRRKLYELIERKMYKDAEKLIDELLDNPYCKEFAQGELEYLKANKYI